MRWLVALFVLLAPARALAGRQTVVVAPLAALGAEEKSAGAKQLQAELEKALAGVEGTTVIDAKEAQAAIAKAKRPELRVCEGDIACLVELGKLVWDYCGMSRNKAGLETALKDIPAIREEFWSDVKVLGEGQSYNQSLEKALRVADFMDMAELKVRDALHREESCGGHFREEQQTEEGEAKRDDENFAYVAAWEYGGPDIQNDAILNKEPLVFENVTLSQRSYK